MSGRQFLFIHQNFPAQFVHVAAELVKLGHRVVALGIKGRQLQGVEYLRYAPKPPSRVSEVEAAQDFEVKVVRGIACAQVMEQLRDKGFQPDVIVAHPGWGEALFCKDVWPKARLVIFAEFFYSAEGSDFNFDKEFATDTVNARARLRMKNSVHLHALQAADAVYSPTRWQAEQLPREFWHKVEVIFDGIDTSVVAPDDGAFIQIHRSGIRLTGANEVLTLVNRNMEPYRGFHVFMRALPEIMARRPNAHCLIVGGNDVSYGAKPKNGRNWHEVMMAEVGHRLPMERVHFLGMLPYIDYLRVIQISSCHVYMTYPFVLSWSCLEAMSLGRVVLASDTGPVREVITNGENGLLFDFFDGASLTDKACAVLADRQAFAALGVNARATVVRNYDLRSVCLPRLLKLLIGD